MFLSSFDLDGRGAVMSLAQLHKDDLIRELYRILREGHGNYNPDDPQSTRRTPSAVRIFADYLEHIRKEDPLYYVPDDMIELIRENYRQDATYHASCYAGYFHRTYQGIANDFNFPLMVSRPDELVIAKAIQDNFRNDIATAPMQFLYSYVVSAHEASRRLGAPLDVREISRLIYDRVEKEIETLDPVKVQDVISHMEQSLHRINQQQPHGSRIILDAEHRKDIYRIVMTGGIDAINRSFTEAASPEAPSNGEIVWAITSSLALIGVSNANLSVARIAVTGAEERANLREFTQNLRLELAL